MLIAATVGIWLLAGAAFAVNCLVEREIDSRMARTARRPMARGEITVPQTLLFSGVIGGAGMWVLYTLVNPLTMWLTFATFVGYAVIYTIILKPATPQNIVIGGLSGAMPPALGWAAVANDVPMQAWMLVLIIFVWTPPHFWALAHVPPRRLREVRPADAAHHPRHEVHPVSHLAVHDRAGRHHHAAVTQCSMSGLVYLVSAVVLDAIFLRYAWRIYRNYSDQLARKTFTYSIIYLSLLFAALLVDHYLPF